MHLKDTTVRIAKPKDKAYRIFDGDGLYLEVQGKRIPNRQDSALFQRRFLSYS